MADVPLPGYVCVFAKKHVIEPFDLSEAHQAQVFLDCMAVARGVAAAVEPIKTNYEIHGNTAPHLHMHLFPRQASDAYVGLPNRCRAVFTRSPATLDRIAGSGAGQPRGSADGLRPLTPPGGWPHPSLGAASWNNLGEQSWGMEAISGHDRETGQHGIDDLADLL